MSDTPNEIDDLLRQTYAARGDIEAFARLHLEFFRQAMWRVVYRQRTEGRMRVLLGEDPDVILGEVNARIAEVQEGFRGKLERLVLWGRTTGRM